MPFSESFIENEINDAELKGFLVLKKLLLRN